MALVLMATMPWGQLWDKLGNAQVGETVVLKERDGATLITHYLDATGADPSTVGIPSDERGRLMRYVEEGSYDLLDRGETLPVEATAGATVGAISRAWVPDSAFPGASLQAAVDDLVAEGGRGRITGPGGQYTMEQTVTIPPGSSIHLEFGGLAGGPTSHEQYGTRLLRSASLAGPVIKAWGTGTSAAQRVHLTLEKVEISSKNGAVDPTKPLLDVRRGAIHMDKVRIAYSNGIGAYFAELWNSNWGSVFVYTCGLSGVTYPAVIFDSVWKATGGAVAAPSWATIDAAAASGNDTATVLVAAMQCENNAGTDLLFTGDPNVGVAALCEDVQIGLLKMEGGSGSHPYIDLDYAQNIDVASLRLRTAAARTGTPIVQRLACNDGGSRGNRLRGVVDMGAATPYVVDQQGGEMFLQLNETGAAPSTAYHRIGSGVPANRHRVMGSRIPISAVTRFEDNRTIDERLGKREVFVPPLLVTAFANNNDNAVINAAHAATPSWSGQVVVPDDVEAGSTVKFRFYYYFTAAPAAGNIFWQALTLNSFKQNDGTNNPNTASASFNAITAAPAGTTAQVAETASGPTVRPGDILRVKGVRLGSDVLDTAVDTARWYGFAVVYERKLA